QQFLEKLGAVCDLSRLRYLVLNHMEQDHTSSVPLLRRLVPGLTIVCTAKARDMLESFYGVTENIRVVDEGDTLSLGE
ncbi:MAG: FprA family A-type flavoprotein, partial [Gemmatimonadales bacterium]|nr:FprA family A-type flavoprotein [Gemmatimonadales bacterium]